MRVKIGDTIYDPNKEPILLILEPMDRLNIIGMPAQNNLYYAFPRDYPKNKLDEFLKLPEVLPNDMGPDPVVNGEDKKSGKIHKLLPKKRKRNDDIN